MRNRTKKEQKQLEELMLFFVLASGIMGWFLAGTFTGVAIAVCISLAIIIVVSVWRSRRFKERMRRSGIDDIDNMTGRQFEEYAGALFSSQGYGVTFTPTTGDFGADLLLKKGSDVIVVQAKRYKQSVGVKAVQEVIPAINMYDATAAWVITNSSFTKQALLLAKRNHVRMIDREELIQMSLEMNRLANKTVVKVV